MLLELMASANQMLGYKKKKSIEVHEVLRIAGSWGWIWEWVKGGVQMTMIKIHGRKFSNNI